MVRASPTLKEGGDVAGSQLIKVVWNGALARQQAETPTWRRRVVIALQAGDPHQRIAGLADHEPLARDGLSHQVREMGLGLMQVDLTHKTMAKQTSFN